MNFFDLHCDTATYSFDNDCDISEDKTAVFCPKNKIFNKWSQTFAFFINDNCKNPFEYYKNAFSDFKNKRRIFSDCEMILTVENGNLIGEDLSRLVSLKNDGIKALTLCWNGENQIGGGVNSDAPLKPFGEKIIKVLNSYRIACDLSHLNKKSFFKAVQIAEFPYASHSCCSAIFEHKRNLNDAQLLSIKERNGIVGICFYPEFLGQGSPLDKIYANVMHLLDLEMENNISFGSDFDGCTINSNLSKITHVPYLYEYLGNHGLNYSLLDKIFYKNAHNFFAKL